MNHGATPRGSDTVGGETTAIDGVKPHRPGGFAGRSESSPRSVRGHGPLHEFRIRAESAAQKKKGDAEGGVP